MNTMQNNTFIGEDRGGAALRFSFHLVPIRDQNLPRRRIHCKKNRVNFPPWYGGNRRTFDSRSEFTNISKITLSRRIYYLS